MACAKWVVKRTKNAPVVTSGPFRTRSLGRPYGMNTGCAQVLGAGTRLPRPVPIRRASPVHSRHSAPGSSWAPHCCPPTPPSRPHALRPHPSPGALPAPEIVCCAPLRPAEGRARMNRHLSLVATLLVCSLLAATAARAEDANARFTSWAETYAASDSPKTRAALEPQGLGLALIPPGRALPPHPARSRARALPVAALPPRPGNARVHRRAARNAHRRHGLARGPRPVQPLPRRPHPHRAHRPHRRASLRSCTPTAPRSPCTPASASPCTASRSTVTWRCSTRAPAGSSRPSRPTPPSAVVDAPRPARPRRRRHRLLRRRELGPIARARARLSRPPARPRAAALALDHRHQEGPLHPGRLLRLARATRSPSPRRSPR